MTTTYHIDGHTWTRPPVVVIEGPDGLGKTSLVDALTDYLSSHLVPPTGLKVSREPGGAIRALLASGAKWAPATIDLLMTASHTEVVAWVDRQPATTLILMDRWSPISGYAYMLGQRGRTARDYFALSHYHRRADLVLWLDGDYDLMRSRTPAKPPETILDGDLLAAWDNMDRASWESVRSQYRHLFTFYNTAVTRLDAALPPSALLDLAVGEIVYQFGATHAIL